MIKNIFFIFLLTLIFSGGFVKAEDLTQIKTLMLTPEQRVLINQQREQFLLNPLVGHKEIAQPKPPKKVVITAIIVTPEGNKIIRLNGDFTTAPSKQIKITTDKNIKITP